MILKQNLVGGRTHSAFIPPPPTLTHTMPNSKSIIIIILYTLANSILLSSFYPVRMFSDQVQNGLAKACCYIMYTLNPIFIYDCNSSCYCL